MSWNVPENKLSVRQREIMTKLWKTPATRHWIQGCAGSGKTLVLLHAMERLAVEKPKATICFITFTHALKDLVKSGLSPSVRSRIVISTHTEFLRKKQRFDHVFLDEVQDIKTADLAAIKELSGTLQLAGDPDQQIYSHGSDEEGVNAALAPVRERLMDVFRLSSLLRKLALTILPKTKLVEGRDKGTGPTYQIKLVRFDSEASEAAWMFNEALACAKGGFNASAILFSTHDQIARFSSHVARHLGKPKPPGRTKNPPNSSEQTLEYAQFNEFWKSNGVPIAYLGSGNGDFSESEFRPMVYFMTYHSAKGLDFESVFLPGVNDGLYLHANNFPGDADAERRLLYVAVTRSRTRLFVSHTGSLHPLFRDHPQDLVVEVSPKMRAAEPAGGLF
jgi:superfamily I DNA/RNA helicase